MKQEDRTYIDRELIALVKAVKVVAEGLDDETVAPVLMPLMEVVSHAERIGLMIDQHICHTSFTYKGYRIMVAERPDFFDVLVKDTTCPGERQDFNFHKIEAAIEWCDTDEKTTRPSEEEAEQRADYDDYITGHNAMNLDCDPPLNFEEWQQEVGFDHLADSQKA